MYYTSNMPQQSEAYFQRFMEKKALNNRGNGIALALIGMTAVPIAFASIANMVMEKLGWVDYEKYGALYSYMKPEVYYIYYSVLYLSMVLVPFLILVPIYHMQGREVLPLSRRVPGKMLLLASMAGMSCCLVANAVTTGWCGVLEGIFGIVSVPGDLPMDRSITSRLLFFCIYAILPALAEEIAFRGVVFGLLRPYGKTIAVVGSAFVFGIMHGNLMQIPFAFIGGLFFGYLLAETGSIVPCMLLHFYNNGLSVIQMFLMADLSPEAADHVAYGMIILMLALGVVCLILLMKKNPRLFRMEEDAGALTNKEKFRAIAMSPAMWIAYLIIAVEMIASMQFK